MEEAKSFLQRNPEFGNLWKRSSGKILTVAGSITFGFVSGVWLLGTKYGENKKSTEENKSLIMNIGSITSDVGYLKDNLNEMKGNFGSLKTSVETIPKTLEDYTVKRIKEHEKSERIFTTISTIIICGVIILFKN
jgi:hypothetical protein